MAVEVHWLDSGRTVRAEPGQTLLQIAQDHGIDLDHACGGVCACSTCHVKILEGMELLSEQEDEEADQLDEARDLGLDSRLSCQSRILADAGRIVVGIPAWNVNLAREPHG
ncbi:MAG: 2Fe-2S iron-sulfur cluster-binding protein [Planctomycetota bacterium]